MVSDGNVPVLLIGAVSRYGKLDARSVFVTVLPPLHRALLVVGYRERAPPLVLGLAACLGVATVPGSPKESLVWERF